MFSNIKITYNLFVGLIFATSFTSLFQYQLSFLLLLSTIFYILNNIGKKIILREIMAFHGIFICLIMPMIGYEIFNQSNIYFSAFSRYMIIEKEEYYNLVLPCLSGFIFGLTLNTNYSIAIENQTLPLLYKAKQKLVAIKGDKIGAFLIGIAVFSYLISQSIPSSFRFFVLLFYFSGFAGFVYLFHSKRNSFNLFFLVLFAIFNIYSALQEGMFTVIIYMGATIISFITLGLRWTLFKKTLLLGVIILVLFIMQTVKSEYRSYIWGNAYSGSKSELFYSLAKNAGFNYQNLIKTTGLFPIYYRSNQGFNINLVMQNIPAAKPFDNGAFLFKAIGSSLVPRFIWPDRPMSGGKSNMKYFANAELNGISTNVSPIGEAYGSFGVNGAIIFMLILGLAIRWVYFKYFYFAKNAPLLLFWMPVVFYQSSYSLESDTLQIANSIIKSSFFILMLLVIFPRWFGLTSLGPKKHIKNSNQ